MYNFYILCCVAALIGMSSAEVRIDIEPATDPYKLMEGSKLKIACLVTSDEDITEPAINLKFKKDDADLMTGTGSDWSKIMMDNPKSYSLIVTKDSAEKSDSGNYLCELGASLNRPLRVHVLQISSPTDVVFNDTKVELACDPGSLSDAYDLVWMKGDKTLEETSIKGRYTTTGNKLIISKPEWKDLGAYTCIFTFTDTKQMLNHTVNLIGAPKINEKEFGKSKNLVQGDDLKLTCPASGYPYPVVTWYKDGETLINGVKRVQITTDGSVKNNKLTVYSLEFSDAGKYTCVANSTYESFASASSDTTIRVKDRLAALWPFLGIVAEVIILCIIIFIYEKRRSKQMEDDADCSADYTANTQDHQTEVRQRNVRT